MNRLITNIKDKNGRNNFRQAIGKTLEVEYQGVIYKIECLGYDPKRRQVKIKYGESIEEIHKDQLLGGGIGKITKLYVMDYRWKRGDIVNNLLIEDCIRFDRMSVKSGAKGYNYTCKNCNNKDSMRESHLLEGKGCNVCGRVPKKVLKGYNDLSTTRPDVVQYLLNKNDRFKYTQGSNKKVKWHCDLCDKIEEKQVVAFCKKGFSCGSCSDTISFPNKFIFSLLNQLNINFESEKTFPWSDKKRYDFYIPDKSLLIEAHGAQHYIQSGFPKTLEEIQKIDRLKRDMATKNKILLVTINCSTSSKNFIKNSILKSELHNFFDLKNVNWDKCAKDAMSNVMDLTIKMWNKGKTVPEIAAFFKISTVSVRKYLKTGNETNLCLYNGREEMLKSNTRKAKKVLSLKDGKIFNSISECAKFYGIQRLAVRRNKNKFQISEE